MSLIDKIKKIARTDELDKKIKKVDLPQNRGTWEGNRGIATSNVTPDTVCPLYYSTSDNSYDIGDIIDGVAGPQLGDKCARINSVTGLTDFDTTFAGDTVHLVIQLDGIFD